MMTIMSSPRHEPEDRRSGAAARILRHARRRARLTQRSLSAASGVPQETIARIESGASMPRFDTLDRLLAACGFGLEVMPRLGLGVDRTLIAWMLEKSPEERLTHGLRAARDMEALRAASARSRATDGQR
jgi:transcriptional regulator with XRE-family HTH domain